jgi:deoxyribodipyrimidine photo-lyase
MLAAATSAAEQVTCAFVADPAILARNEDAHGRVAWFSANIAALDERLRHEASGLVVLTGDPATALRSLAAEIGADAVFAGRDEEPEALARDREVGRHLDLRLVDDQRLLPPDALRSRSGEPFKVFTPFRLALDERLAEDGAAVVAEAVADLGRLAPVRNRTREMVSLAGEASVPPLPDAGEEAAASRLGAFVREDLPRYHGERDRPDLDSTSRLSPYLRTGALSVRAAWRQALDAERQARERRDEGLARAARRWRDELAWREFYAAVLLAAPRVATSSFRPAYDAIGWEAGPAADEALGAWQAGMTGYPIVDAGMRQLVATGWMHNRLRLITASFLVKDLGIDWRRGEAFFMRHLLDGDLAQNNGNWQWVAGVGTDAAPYFRIFNPALQGRRFDPDGSFVRAWLPELQGVPATFVHEPWQAPAGSRPRAYPGPIVDHAAARARTLARYAAARGT